MPADSEHLELLRRGPRAWNEWRRRHPTTVPNLTQIALSAAERQMGPVHGGPINLASARLRRASLRFATLSGANLEEAKVAQSRRDLTAKFSIALKEARETSYWLRLLMATQLAPASFLAPHLQEVEQLVSILTSSVRTLRHQ